MLNWFKRRRKDELLEAPAAEAEQARQEDANALADEIERRRLKFSDPEDGYYEMLSGEEHDQIVAALRKG